MKALTILAFFYLCFNLTACSVSQLRTEEKARLDTITPIDLTQEVLLWASAPNKPKWLTSAPKSSNEGFSFVGASEIRNSRSIAEAEAKKDASERAVRYLNAYVEDSFKKIAENLGLKEIPESAKTALEKIAAHLSEKLDTELQAKLQYSERWLRKTGNSWNSFALVLIPNSIVDNAVFSIVEKNKQSLNHEDETMYENNSLLQKFWAQILETGIAGQQEDL